MNLQKRANTALGKILGYIEARMTKDLPTITRDEERACNQIIGIYKATISQQHADAVTPHISFENLSEEEFDKLCENSFGIENDLD